MTVHIHQKIVGYAVIREPAPTAAPVAAPVADAVAPMTPAMTPATTSAATSATTSAATSATQHRPPVVQMHEKIERPEILLGSTYKIKTPLSEHALYVTINDFILNPGTEHEVRRPFEIFINSKNMDHFQWIVALTRIISAVFRKGGDVTFLVEELRSVFDPRGGYFKKGGRYMPSLVAEIGDAIEGHLRSIGLLEANALDEHQQRHIAGQRAAWATQQHWAQQDTEPGESFPPGAVLCSRCHTKAVIRMDNCMTCLQCGESQCGG